MRRIAVPVVVRHTSVNAAPHPVAERAQYTPAEQKQIRDDYGTAGAAQCPRCLVAMTSRAIGGGSFGLGYARRREWLICPTCHRSALFDMRRGTRN